MARRDGERFPTASPVERIQIKDPSFGFFGCFFTTIFNRIPSTIHHPVHAVRFIT
jgi:hypothetical protein